MRTFDIKLLLAADFLWWPPSRMHGEEFRGYDTIWLQRLPSGGQPPVSAHLMA